MRYFLIILLSGLFISSTFVTAIAQTDLFIIREAGKYGIKDLNGNLAMPAEYDLITKSPDYPFYYLHKNNKTGLADKQGKVVFNCIYSNILCVAPDYVYIADTLKHILLQLSTNEITLCKSSPFLFESVGCHGFPLDSGVLFIHRLTNAKKLLDITSVSSVIAEDMPTQSTNILDFQNILKYYYAHKQNNLGVLNSNLELIVPAYFNTIKLQRGFFIAGNANGIKVFDKKGNVISADAYYSSVSIINSELIVVALRNMYGVLNVGGKLVIPCMYDDITVLNDVILTKVKDRNDVYKYDGTKIFSTLYNIQRADSGFYFTSNMGRFGVLNSVGRQIAENKYTKVAALSADYLSLYESEKISVASKTGIILFADTFHTVNYMPEHNVFLVSKNAGLSIKPILKYGVIGINNQLIIPIVYPFKKLVFGTNEINAYTDTSMLSVALSAKGVVLDKVLYKDFVELTIDTVNQNYWRLDTIPTGSGLNTGYNLYNKFDKRIIGKFYSSYVDNYKNVSNISNAESSVNRTFDIINFYTGKVLFSQLIEVDTLMNEPDYFRLTAEYWSRFILCDNNFKRIAKDYSFISSFNNGLARVAINGGLKLTETYMYNLNIIPFPNLPADIQLKLKSGVRNRYLQCSNCVWGLINLDGKEMLKPEYQFLQREHDGKILAVKSKKWGIINRYNQQLLPFTYSELRFFEDQRIPDSVVWLHTNYLKARLNNLWGVITDSNRVVITLKYQDIMYLPNSNGDFFAVKLNNLWGLVNGSEKVIIPFEYDDINYLSAKLTTYFKVVKSKTVSGFIDFTYEYSIVPQFKSVRSFKNGFAAVEINKQAWNFINHAGKLVSSVNFQEVQDFSEGLAAVKIKNSWSYIDTTGKIVISNMQISDASEFISGLAVIRTNAKKGVLSFFRKGAFGIIDNSGKYVLKPKYKQIKLYPDSFAVLKMRLTYTFVKLQLKPVYIRNKKNIIWYPDFKLLVVTEKPQKAKVYLFDSNKFILQGKSEKVYPFSEGFARVVKYKKTGFIDSTGKLHIPFMFDKAGDFNCGLAFVSINQLYGYVSADSVAIKPQYLYSTDFKFNVAKVKLKKEMFYINRSNHKIVPPQYVFHTAINQISPDRFVVSEPKVKFLIDSLNHVYLKVPDIKYSHSDLFLIQNDNFWGLYNKFGNCIIECNYTDIKPWSEGKMAITTTALTGVYNSYGQIILPAAYLKLKSVSNSVIQVFSVSQIQYFDFKKLKFL